MSTLRKFGYGLLLFAILALVLFALTYKSVLSSVGAYLVETKRPMKADAVIVLAGDYRGDRILGGANLVRDAFAPIVLVSGPAEMYGVNEASMAIQFAVGKGFPATYFEAVFIDAHSTLEEARAFVPILRQREVKRLLLVTSNYHTRRATAIFRKALGGTAEVNTVAVQDPFFRPDSWWHNREGQKIVFYEYSKTMAGWLGM